MGREILVVEDDGLMRSFFAGVLSEAGYRVETAADGAAGLARLREAPRDLVLTDLRLPKLDWVALLREGRLLRPEARWIVVTAHGSIANAVEAMRAGAADYLTKPLSGPEELRLSVARVLREADAEARLALHEEEERRSRPPEELIFAGMAMGPVRALLEQVAGIFFFDVRRARHPHFMFSMAAPNSSITDDFLPLPEGGFLVTQMGSASGGAPGRLAELDRHFRLVGEYPA